jgi:hypothetical protein
MQQYIGSWGLSTGYWLLVGGTALAMLSCCFTVFTNAETLDPDTNFGKGDADLAMEGLDSVAAEGGASGGGAGDDAAQEGSSRNHNSDGHRHLASGYKPQYADVESTQTTQQFMEERAGRSLGVAAASGASAAHSRPEGPPLNAMNWHYHDGPPPAGAGGYVGGPGTLPYAGYAPVVVPMPRFLAKEAIKAAGGKKVSQVQDLRQSPLTPAGGSFFRPAKPKPSVSPATAAAKKGATVAAPPSSTSSTASVAASLSYAKALPPPAQKK